MYEKYGAIFRYFDSLLVGLTATPSDHIDRNTYTALRSGAGRRRPTPYELETAVADGFLVPPRVQQVDLKFPREGIDYDSLSEEEQEQWESLDWGDDVDENGLPDRGQRRRHQQLALQRGHGGQGAPASNGAGVTGSKAVTGSLRRSYSHVTTSTRSLSRSGSTTTIRTTRGTSPASSTTTRSIRRAYSMISRRRTSRPTSRSRSICSTPASTCPR